MRDSNTRSDLEQVLSDLRDAESRHDALRRILAARMSNAMLKTVYALFETEQQLVCGARYARKDARLAHRGGSEQGSILLNGQWVRLRHPRMRRDGEEAPSRAYDALRDFDLCCDEIAAKVIRGVSCGNFGEAVDRIAGAVPLPRSTVSAAFVKASEKDLLEINGRDLSSHRFVAIFIDGIVFAGVPIVVALGVTGAGEKIPVGIREGSSENTRVGVDLLDNLLERGLKMTSRVLVIVDGSRALRAAVKQKFGDAAVVQRCTLHKTRNVLEYVPRRYHAEARRRLNAAWSANAYADAKTELLKVVAWVRGISDKAAASLEEGLEETLTMQRLGVSAGLRKTFSTTNPIESLFSMVRPMTRRVCRWRNANHHRERWVATALRVAEKRMRKVKAWRQLPELIQTLENFSVAIEVNA